MTILGADTFHASLEEFLNSEPSDAVTLNSRLQDLLDSLTWLRNRVVQHGVLIGTHDNTTAVTTEAGASGVVMQVTFPGQISGDRLAFTAHPRIDSASGAGVLRTEYSDDSGATWTNAVQDVPVSGSCLGYYAVPVLIVDTNAVVHSRTVRLSMIVAPPTGSVVWRSSNQLGTYTIVRAIS